MRGVPLMSSGPMLQKINFCSSCLEHFLTCWVRKALCFYESHGPLYEHVEFMENMALLSASLDSVCNMRQISPAYAVQYITEVSSKGHSGKLNKN